ncbi:MAG: hypothetical protein IKG80_05555, partial [Clostridia bacterium]|nr:hypothetical protein [Clostridia bacterium]
MPNSPCDRGRDTVCIDTYRVLDSCRDKDCFEDAQANLTASLSTDEEGRTLYNALRDRQDLPIVE